MGKNGSFGDFSQVVSFVLKFKYQYQSRYFDVHVIIFNSCSYSLITTILSPWVLLILVILDHFKIVRI